MVRCRFSPSLALTLSSHYIFFLSLLLYKTHFAFLLYILSPHLFGLRLPPPHNTLPIITNSPLLPFPSYKTKKEEKGRS